MMNPTIRDIKQIITNQLGINLKSFLMYNDKRKEHNRVKLMGTLTDEQMNQLKNELAHRFPNFWFQVQEGEWKTHSWSARTIPVTLVRFGLAK